MFGFGKKKNDYEKLIKKAEQNLKRNKKLSESFSNQTFDFITNTNAMIEVANKR